MKKRPREISFTIRLAAQADADGMGHLSTQLGYLSSREEVERRLSHITRDEDHAVYVAVRPGGEVLGWVHVCASYLAEGDPEAEIGGLVVDEAHRGSGVGKRMMQRAEQWAREKGLRSVYLRSNIIRKDAHEFYEKLGYSIIKTQYAFRKLL